MSESNEPQLDIIDCKPYGEGLGQYRSKNSAIKIAEMIKNDMADGIACHVDMSDIDTATAEFMNELVNRIYDGEYDFAWIDANVTLMFGRGELATYYRTAYRKLAFLAKVRYNKEHGIAMPQTLERVDVVIHDIVKMDNFVFEWQTKPIYDRVIEILKQGKAVRIDFTRKGRMNMAFLHSLLIGFYSDKDVSFEEIRTRLYLKWDEKSKRHDKELFTDFKEMMATYRRRLQQVAEIREQKASIANKLDRVFGNEPRKPAESVQRAGEDRHSKKLERRRRDDYGDDDDDWKNSWR